MNLLVTAAVLLLSAIIHAKPYLSNDNDEGMLILKAVGDSRQENDEDSSLGEHVYRYEEQNGSLSPMSMAEPIWLHRSAPRELIARAAKGKTLKRRIRGSKLRKKGGRKGGKKKTNKKKSRKRKKKSKGKRRQKPKPKPKPRPVPKPPVVPKRNITRWKSKDGITYRLMVITDLDKKARAVEKDTWKAITREGNLTLKNNLTIEIKWEEQKRDHELIGYLNYKGRAMEMSDIVEFDNRRLTVDDKTGLVYDITSGKAIPWIFLNSGPGNTTSGMKVEWLTVKDNLLYAGGHGSEFRNTTTGNITSMDPMWIKTITKTGEVKSVNWFWEFSRLRNESNYPAPGYLTHEAVQWSAIRRRWFFLPRKASTTAYNETEDETKGCQLLITADENFEKIAVRNITGKAKPDPRKGYSAFDFIPGSWDTVMVALKSEEVDNSTKSFVSVVATNGTVLLEDQELEGDHKFEGIYFI